MATAVVQSVLWLQMETLVKARWFVASTALTRLAPDDLLPQQLERFVEIALAYFAADAVD